jgi:hypothetical protein
LQDGDRLPCADHIITGVPYIVKVSSLCVVQTLFFIHPNRTQTHIRKPGRRPASRNPDPRCPPSYWLPTSSQRSMTLRSLCYNRGLLCAVTVIPPSILGPLLTLAVKQLCHVDGVAGTGSITNVSRKWCCELWWCYNCVTQVV